MAGCDNSGTFSAFEPSAYRHRRAVIELRCDVDALFHPRFGRDERMIEERQLCHDDGIGCGVETCDNSVPLAGDQRRAARDGVYPARAIGNPQRRCTCFIDHQSEAASIRRPFRDQALFAARRQRWPDHCLNLKARQARKLRVVRDYRTRSGVNGLKSAGVRTGRGPIDADLFKARPVGIHVAVDDANEIHAIWRAELA